VEDVSSNFQGIMKLKIVVPRAIMKRGGKFLLRRPVFTIKGN
jgi:hypothetical protein